MSKRALRSLIERENFFRNLREEPLIDINALYKISDENVELANALFQRIDGHLSPENLHQDGEATQREIQQEFNMLYGAVEQLRNMGYNVPESCWEINTEC